MAEDSNGSVQDLNQNETINDTSQHNADSVGKTFLRNVKEKWNNVPQGWAQKRTNPKESSDSSPLSSTAEDVASTTKDSPPGGEGTE
jgi:hypothetical protein